jgi:hypothetical protein
MSGRFRLVLSLILGCLSLGISSGCISIHSTPGRRATVEVLDSNDKPLDEWWVVTWREKRQCDFGVITTLHGLNMSPQRKSLDAVGLHRMTPGSNVMSFPGSYRVYLCYLLLLFPPAGAWEGNAYFTIVAAGKTDQWMCKGSFGAQDKFIYQDPDTSQWKVQVINRAIRWNQDLDYAPLPENVPEEVLSILAKSPELKSDDLKAFQAILKSRPKP